jgi:Lipase (class 3)
MYIHVPNDRALGESLEYFENPFIGSLGLTATAPTLEEMTCRLLCASLLAYVPPPGQTSPYYSGDNLLYYTKAGFIDHPTVIDGVGTNKIDACLVGTFNFKGSGYEQNNVVLAFRGTVKDFAADWYNDAEIKQVNFRKIPGVADVHHGFNDSVNAFFGPGNEKAISCIRARLNAHPGARLYITGHSKGGALAHLTALLLRTEHPEIPLAGVISFEAPRAGGKNFAAAYNAQKIDSLRYECQDDPAPHVPQSTFIANLMAKSLIASAVLAKFYSSSPRTLIYEHVGRLRFIDWIERIVDDSAALEAARFAQLAALLVPSLGVTTLLLLANKHPVGKGTVTWKVLTQQTSLCK